MADVKKRVSGKMQLDLDTEGGGVVRASYEMATELNKVVGTFTGEIGVTVAELGNKEEATCRFTGEIGVAKANKEAVGSSCISEVGVTKAGLGNNVAAGGGFTGDISVTKAAGLGNKEEAPGTGMVTAASGSRIKLPVSSEDHVAALVAKERVSDSYITRIKRRPMRKMSLPTGDLYDDFASDPSELGALLASIAHINNLVDVEQDCLRQHAEKGYAEIGVDYTNGVREVFVLPTQASGSN